MDFDGIGAESPLSSALAQRDASIMEMVRRALRRKEVLLAYQPVIQGQDHSRVAFYEGLIRVLDETGRIIPAKDFIETIETREEGRMIDCLAIELVPDLVIDFMARMQRRGISFALDDFGAGYTAFRHFKDFYFDVVKIDATFVRHIDTDTDNQVLMQALVSIAQQFDMFTVAEGIERPEEAKYLAHLGVDCLQGYLFGVPTPAKPWLVDSGPGQAKIAG